MAIDRLFGEGRWKEKLNYGDIHGIRIWEVILDDGNTEKIYFDYSPAAKMVADNEAGLLEPLLTPKQMREGQKMMSELMTKGRANMMRNAAAERKADIEHPISKILTAVMMISWVVATVAMINAWDLGTNFLIGGGTFVATIIIGYIMSLLDDRAKAQAQATSKKTSN